jgi:hypothetical protein
MGDITITDDWAEHAGRHLTITERVAVVQVAITLHDTFGWPTEETVQTILATIKKAETQER